MKAKGPYTVIGYDAERCEMVRREADTLPDAKLEVTLIKTDPEYRNDLQRTAIYDTNNITIEDVDLSSVMSVEERCEYVNNVCDRLRNRLLSKTALFPKEWDGYDISALVLLIANEMFSYNQPTSTQKKRLKDVKNEYIVRNL
jgi:hypothetical protein